MQCKPDLDCIRFFYITLHSINYELRGLGLYDVLINTWCVESLLAITISIDLHQDEKLI